MTGAQYLMLAAAVLCAVSWRWNATAAALAFSYAATQAWWLIMGVYDVGVLFMVDLMTGCLIFCKAVARCPDQDYRSGAEHLRCMVASFTAADRIVLAVFPVMWAAYVLRIGEYERWWLLYFAAMVQFLAAGGEAFIEWRRAKASESEPDNPSSGLMFAVARAGRWST